MILALSLLAPTPWLVKWRSNPKKMLILPQDNSAKVYPHFVQQAYQADVLTPQSFNVLRWYTLPTQRSSRNYR